MSQLSGDNIREAREALGWSRSELARRCGMQSQTIEIMEASKKHSTILPAFARRLSAAFEFAGVTFEHDIDGHLRAKVGDFIRKFVGTNQ